MADSLAVMAARAAVESWNAGDPRRHRDSLAGDALLTEHATGREVRGAQAITQLHFAWREAFPDALGRVTGVVDGGDAACVMQVVWAGTHTGPLAVPGLPVLAPTGRAVRVPACLVMRVEGGRVARQDHYFDLLGLMTQLGVRPPGG